MEAKLATVGVNWPRALYSGLYFDLVVVLW